VKWGGAIRLEMEWMPVEVHTEITNMWKQGDKFHKETENN